MEGMSGYSSSEAGERIEQLAVQLIDPNPRQPRKRFPVRALRTLAQSIASQGVMQPLVVRPHPKEATRYQLVAGERRLRAVKWLGWTQAPALVRTVPDESLLELALIENLQREPLSPIEEAQSYRTLMDAFGYTQETLAAKVGKDRSTIANMVRLLMLPQPIQQDLEEERLSIGHARALLTAGGMEQRLLLRDSVIRSGLSVRATEKLVQRSVRDAKHTSRRENSGEPALSAAQQSLIEHLERRFATRVGFQQAQDGGGRVAIEFYSSEDFNRIFDLLMGRQS